AWAAAPGEPAVAGDEEPVGDEAVEVEGRQSPADAHGGRRLVSPGSVVPRGGIEIETSASGVGKRGEGGDARVGVRRIHGSHPACSTSWNLRNLPARSLILAEISACQERGQSWPQPGSRVRWGS